MAIPRPAFPSKPPSASGGGFSLHPTSSADLRSAKPLGHHESAHDLNLGFGFLYYGLVRTLRPRHVLVIGSGFGFSVVPCAGLKDNAKGELHFVDPSYSVLTDGPFRTVGGTSQWHDPEKVVRRFARFGVEDIVTHYRKRSDEYFDDYDALGLPPIDLAFIDGSHAYADVRSDFLSPCATRARTPTSCCTTPISTCASSCVMQA